MLGQTFDLTDIARLTTLVFLELLLSADNAIILGLLVHSLPEKLKKKALFIGVISAFGLRLAALLAVSFLIQYRWIQILGAAYLVYLTIRHFSSKSSRFRVSPAASFWKTVLKIELFDLAFSIDSIIAGLVFIISGPVTQTIHPKLWIVYTGGMIGLIGVRYAATLFSKLLTRFPRLETSAYLMVGWIGIKLALLSIFDIPNFTPFFWGGLAALFALGLIKE